MPVSTFFYSPLSRLNLSFFCRHSGVSLSVLLLDGFSPSTLGVSGIAQPTATRSDHRHLNPRVVSLLSRESVIGQDAANRTQHERTRQGCATLTASLTTFRLCAEFFFLVSLGLGRTRRSLPIWLSHPLPSSDRQCRPHRPAKTTTLSTSTPPAPMTRRLVRSPAGTKHITSQVALHNPHRPWSPAVATVVMLSSVASPTALLPHSPLSPTTQSRLHHPHSHHQPCRPRH